MPDGNFNSLPIPFVMAENPNSKANSSVTINGLDLTEDRVLKTAQFSEAITGEKMLANLIYTVVSTW